MSDQPKKKLSFVKLIEVINRLVEAENQYSLAFLLTYFLFSRII